MNRLNLALPAFIVFVLFAPNFVSANGLGKLPTAEPVEKTVETTKDTAKDVSATFKEVVEEPSLSEPIDSSVEIVKEAAEPINVEMTTVTEPLKERVKQVVKETGNTVEETKGKIDESLVKPIVEPIDESVLKPVEKTVKERSVVSETVEIVEETVRKTEGKLKDPPVAPVIEEEGASETPESKTVDGDEPVTQQKVKSVPIEEPDVVLSVEPYPDINGEVSLYQVNNDDSSKSEYTVRVKEPSNGSPLTKNRPLNNQAVTAPTIQTGNPSVSVKSSSDLGVSAFLESLKMDFTTEARWSNPEEAGKSQWSHAPPGKPPKSLSFL